MLNAILSCFEDNDSLVKRAALDLLIAHVRLTDTELLGEELIPQLVQGAILLFFKKEHSISRRVMNWLFGPPDLDGKYGLEKDGGLPLRLVSQAFIRIFKAEDWLIDAERPVKLFYNFFIETRPC